MKKQFLRVKQIADQTFLRAEKSDVLTEDLLNAEKRVESIKLSCQATQKKIAACQIDFGSETSVEKRMRKIPQVLLGTSMLESGSSFSKNSVLGDTLRECASVQTKLGTELLDHNNEVEKLVLKPISSVLDNEIHNINKLRKQLGKLVLDMDSARTRFQTAEKHSMQASVNNNFNTVGKVDNLKEELEDASQKVDQCRDLLAAEMFSLISKEPQLAQLFVSFHQLQAAYHRNALTALEASLPVLEKIIHNFPQKPVYGCPLDEHLRVTNREIAQVIETSISFLLEYGILEEGLLRIAGSASKLKKLKNAFDAGIEPDLVEFIRDPHVVSGGNYRF
ncbi:Rho GTPase-activating protein 17 like protein [Argiope bruennichi]|uniref:Rho GTPase-activating protein 17 like protein n=1 Tax=Argiope bruennichi TaxID=94029 RepID=A0A8T0FWQ3_ARGBR|nr:Rho GTPase-activating protein 17 like protein [Argiope bruennichi]